jgi:hypothetical protein
VQASSRLSPQQRASIESAVAEAERVSGLPFAVHVGPLEHGRESAELLHAGCPDPERTVLVAVDPVARLIEIVTGGSAAARLSDRTCGLAALAMASSFQAGDLVRGLRDGLRLLADHARGPEVRHLDVY